MNLTQVRTQKGKTLLHLCLFALISIAAIALVRDTLENGHDFTVFWNAARAILTLNPLYAIERDGGMIFKYPPWILPLFIPFGFFTLSVAKLIWGLVQVFSLAMIILWVLTQAHCRKTTCFAVLVIYWGLWAVHALDGQIALTMLAITLWAWTPTVFERSWIRSSLLTYFLSVKVFTLLPLIYFIQSRFSLRGVIKILGCFVFFLSVFLVFSIPAVLSEPSHSLASLLLHWKNAAASGGSLLSAEQIRGRYNPSLTNFFLKIGQVPADQAWADILTACILALGLGLLWKHFSRRMPEKDSWVGWLALVPVIHPLPWWHLFVFTFPLAVVSVERAADQTLDPAYQGSRSRWRGEFFLAWIGVLLIAAGTEKVLGSIGLFLEMNAGKSWGVLLCLMALMISHERSRERRRIR